MAGMILMKMHVARVPLLAAALSLGGVAPARAAQRARPRDRGGLSLLLAVKADGQRMEWSVRRTAAVIKKRCAALGIRCELRPQAGDQANRLLLRFSTSGDPGRVKRVLLARGLEVRGGVSPPQPSPLREYSTRAAAAAAAGNDTDVCPLGDSGAETYLVVERAAIVTGDDARDCAALRSGGRGISSVYEVDCQLRPAGAARLKAWTGANINRYVAVIFDGRVLDAPYIRAPIWYNIVVSGGFNRRQAEDVALILASGNLPAPVELLEEGVYQPRVPSPGRTVVRRTINL